MSTGEQMSPALDLLTISADYEACRGQERRKKTRSGSIAKTGCWFLILCYGVQILDASVMGLFIVVFLCPRRPQWTLFYGKDFVPFFAMVLVSVCDPVSAMSEFP